MSELRADAAAAVVFPLSLAHYTTMRVGGDAERLRVVHTTAELCKVARELWESHEPWLLLGGGSNTVVCDEGFPGTVVLARNEGFEVIAQSGVSGHGSAGVAADAHQSSVAVSPLDETIRLRVQAGQHWDSLVAECVRRGWVGLEALSGIPGCVGAAPVQNIGAYGSELSDVLHSIEFLDRDRDEVLRLSAAELELGYRDSALKRGREGVVLSVDLLLHTAVSEGAPVRYAQLATALGCSVGDRVPAQQLRDAVLRLRAAKGMVLSDSDRDSWSAGSFFTNPIVSEHFARSLPSAAPKFPLDVREVAAAVTTFEELAAGVPLRVPEPPEAGQVKLSAAWLIEQSGIPKGFRLPGSGAGVSTKHTLALTNREHASAADVAELARFIVQRVQQEFGVILQPEPNLYGLEL